MLVHTSEHACETSVTVQNAYACMAVQQWGVRRFQRDSTSCLSRAMAWLPETLIPMPPPHEEDLAPTSSVATGFDRNTSGPPHKSPRRNTSSFPYQSGMLAVRVTHTEAAPQEVVAHPSQSASFSSFSKNHPQQNPPSLRCPHSLRFHCSCGCPGLRQRTDCLAYWGLEGALCLRCLHCPRYHHYGGQV